MIAVPLVGSASPLVDAPYQLGAAAACEMAARRRHPRRATFRRRFASPWADRGRAHRV